ncbi:hypothetical protein BROUX41_004814 [Berkeleyomyces rouxiae]
MCPYLVQKGCVCGKKVMQNVPCGGRTPTCGLPCGKILGCGKHFCTRPCHQGECESTTEGEPKCDQICNGSRNICGHPCASKCHGTDDCPEERSCQERISLSCPCRRRKREVRCLANTLDSTPKREPLVCDDECARLLRLQSIAQALGVDPEKSATTKTNPAYSDDTMEMFEQRTGWCAFQENEIRKFVMSKETRLRFKAMGKPSRTFIHLLAADLGLKSESQDQEPNRTVLVYKRDGQAPILPAMTLGEACKARAEQTRTAIAAAQTQAPATSHTDKTARPLKPSFFNTVAVKNVPFGMTLDELTSLLSDALVTNADLIFKPYFTEDNTAYFCASHRSGMAPSSLEYLVKRAKGVASSIMARHDTSVCVCMCTTDGNLSVTRWEKVVPPGGWEQVSGRQKASSSKTGGGQSMAAIAAAASSGASSNRNSGASSSSSSAAPRGRLGQQSATFVLRRKALPVNRFASMLLLDPDNEVENNGAPAAATDAETDRQEMQDQDGIKEEKNGGGDGQNGGAHNSEKAVESNVNAGSFTESEQEQQPLRRLQPSAYEQLHHSSSMDDW